MSKKMKDAIVTVATVAVGVIVAALVVAWGARNDIPVLSDADQAF